ncbi:MAG: hypothetical protein H6745_18835 [Deltaproteobacteria bacterium]|nr:hypothetical protein [Deltaproteobacteria bacterium]
MREHGAWRVVMMAALAAAALMACKSDEAPPAETTAPPAAETVPPAEAAADAASEAAPPMGTEADATSEAAADTASPPLEPPPTEVVPPDEVAALAVVVAEIDCTAVQFEDPTAHDRAVEAILLRAGMTQDEYSDKVMKVIDDPTFKAVRERSAEMCKTRVEAQNTPGGLDAEGALRENLKALAVASECMRKSGATTEEQAQAMLALYSAHHIDLQTYTREMSKLANNRSFQEEVAAETAKCPGPEAVAAGGEEPAGGEETGAPPTEETAATEAGPGDAEPPPETPPEAPPEEPKKATITGVYLGTVNPGGTMRVAINSRTVGVATATIDGLNFRLNGRVMRDNVVHLAASAGDHWVQMRGKVDPEKRVYSGTWNGVLNGKRKSGTFSLKR